MKKNRMSMQKLTFCWILGLALMSIPVCLDNFTTLPIDYGSSSGICFIEPRLYLIGFFIGPSLFLFVVNAICFIMTIVNICRILPSNAEVATASDRNVAVLFARIGALMGVTYLFALVPYITGIEEFWYVFAIMNGLQGVYIFMSSGIIGNLRLLFFPTERPQEINATAGSEMDTKF